MCAALTAKDPGVPAIVPLLVVPSPQSTSAVRALGVSDAIASTTVATVPLKATPWVALNAVRVTPSCVWHWLDRHVLPPLQAKVGPHPPQLLSFVRSSTHWLLDPDPQSVGALVGQVERQAYGPPALV